MVLVFSAVQYPNFKLRKDYLIHVKKHNVFRTTPKLAKWPVPLQHVVGRESTRYITDNDCVKDVEAAAYSDLGKKKKTAIIKVTKNILVLYLER